MITDVKLEGAFAHKWVVDLKVKLGNGYSKQYQKYDIGRRYAFDFAVTKAVSAMLSDENVINYLKND